MTDQCSPNGDSFFSVFTNVRCGGSFDFTLVFEQALLGLLPAVVFILAGGFRLVQLSSKKTKTTASTQRALKLATAAIFALLQLALLILWGTERSSRTTTSIPLAVLELIIAIQLLGLVWLEDSKSVRPSSIISVYLVITLLFDIVQARTLWIQHSNLPLASIFLARTSIKVILLLLEAQSKRSFLKASYQHLPPESTGGIIDRSFLWWVNDLFYRGYRTVLAIDDLYTLDDKLRSAYLSARIQEAWKSRRQPERRFEYPWAICRALWRQLLLASLPRVLLIGFLFAQPSLIFRTLHLLSEPITPETTAISYGLIAATAFVYLGIALSNLHYNHNFYRFITMFRGAAVSGIYDHLMTLSDDDCDKSATLTLMTADVDRIAICIESLNECWARSIEVTVGITLLALQLGWICVIPILLVLVAFYGGGRISRTIGNKQKVWMDALQVRVTFTASVLADMKTIKMLGLSNLVASMLQEKRVEETFQMLAFRWSIVWQNIVQNLPWALAPALTFTVYVAQAVSQGRSSIGTTQAFTSLAIINLLTDPTAKLVSAIPMTAASLGCFDRIQKFLTTKPKPEQRILARGDVGSSVDDDDDSKIICITVQIVALRPSPSSDILLRNIDFSVSLGTLTMIAGRIGSGKSTLLRALLGETCLEAGSSIVLRNFKIAYCAQVPWLPNGTIQEAICGPDGSNGPFDIDWYQRCLNVCDLSRDIASQHNGDQTRIGSGGIKLSGGQRQRIALARALYSKSQIVMLDDIFSALDLDTQKRIFLALFGHDGLLRKSNTSVIFATHAVSYLKYADQILLLSQGTVKQTNSYDEIPRDLLREIAKPTPESEQDQDDEETSEARLAEISQADDLNDCARSTGDLSVYKYYFRHIGWVPGSFFFVSVVLEVFCVSFSQIWLKWWTDAGGGQLALYMTVYLSLAIATSVGQFGYVWSMCVKIAPSTARKFHAILVKSVMRAPQSFFTSTDSGVTLNRFTQDMTLIEGQLSTGVLVTVSNLLSAVACAALVASGSTYMAASVPFLVASVWGIQHVYLRTSRQLRMLDLEAKSPLYSHFLESVSGLSTIRAFGWNASFNAINAKLLDRSQQPYYLLYCVQRWLNLVLDCIVAAEAVLVVGLAVGLRGSTSPGLLGVSLNNVLSFSAALSSFLSGWTMLETSLGSIARLKSFEATVTPEDRPQETLVPDSSWPANGDVVFQSVTATYSGINSGIHNVDLHAKPGRTIGICGRTGSGKSTLVSTVLRLLEISSGKILIDGIDIASVPREIIREQLIVVSQDPLLLTGSIRLNIDPHNKSTDEDIMRVLDRVGLVQLVERVGGITANVNMSSLSQGEHQLMSIARALLAKSHRGKLLLLDEATSSLDLETEAILREVLKTEFSAYTKIIIAHRLDSIIDSDLIAVMNQGKIVETGSPTDLLGKEGGLFKALYETAG